MKKKGIELSINLLVILIISIVLFGFGMIFVKKIFNLTTEKHDEITEITKNQIESMLDSGEKIAMPETTLKLRKGDSGVFGIGVLNTDTDPNPIYKNFYIKIAPGNAYKADGTQTSNSITPNDIVIRKGNPYVIEVNKKEVYSVIVKVPTGATPGTHILNVYVCHNNDHNTGTEKNPECSTISGGTGTEFYDDSVHQIYVEVS